jgi:hypothetical protein
LYIKENLLYCINQFIFLSFLYLFYFNFIRNFFLKKRKKKKKKRKW